MNDSTAKPPPMLTPAATDSRTGLVDAVRMAQLPSKDLMASPQMRAERLRDGQLVASQAPRRRQGEAGALAKINFQEVRPAYRAMPTIRPGSSAAKRRYKGPVKRANLLTAAALARVEECIFSQSRSPESDILKLRLSVRGGLRASEIADLPITAMLDANGRIADDIEIYASKTRTKRVIAMHPEIRAAFETLLRTFPEATHVAFSVGRHRQIRRQSAAAIANWFFRLYRSAGLIGCSSHSGRRTFATEFARLLGVFQASTKDLQLALGHACLSSTECYLEPSDRVGQLIRSLGA